MRMSVLVFVSVPVFVCGRDCVCVRAPAVFVHVIV